MRTELQLICDSPGCLLPADRNRQNTAYVNDESNFNNVCVLHQQELDEYWKEMWAQYREGSGV